MSYNIGEIVLAWKEGLLSLDEAKAAIKTIIEFRYPVYPPESLGETA